MHLSESLHTHMHEYSSAQIQNIIVNHHISISLTLLHHTSSPSLSPVSHKPDHLSQSLYLDPSSSHFHLSLTWIRTIQPSNLLPALRVSCPHQMTLYSAGRQVILIQKSDHSTSLLKTFSGFASGLLGFQGHICPGPFPSLTPFITVFPITHLPPTNQNFLTLCNLQLKYESMLQYQHL